MMRKWLAFVVAAFALAGVAETFSQGNVPLDVHAVALVTNQVSEGRTAALGTWNLPDRTRVAKLGAGTLEVASSTLGPRPLELQVRAGAVTVSNDTAEAQAAAGELSQTILDKCMFWGSVKDSEMNITNGNEVLRLYDVRETNTNAPVRVYLDALQDTNGVPVDVKKPLLNVAEYVRKYGTSTNSHTMLDFRRYGSGAGMRYVNPNGSYNTARPAEGACVYGYVTRDVTFGMLYGNSRTTTEHPPWDQANGQPWPGAWAPAMGMTKLWLDGRDFPRDGRELPYGFHVLNTRFNAYCTDGALAGYFQNALFSRYGQIISSRGGEYLGEIMFFTNTLTHTERAEVQRYLTTKWFGPSPATAKVTLESGAELDVAEGEGDVLARGDGRLVKRGDGAYVYKPRDFENGDAPAVTLEGGSVEANRVLAVKATAGKVLTASLPYLQQKAVTLTLADAVRSDSIEKAGLGEAALCDIPEGTRNLVVSAGTLILRPTAPAVKRYEVAIPNGDFSDWGGDTTHGTVYATYGGWSRTGVAIFYNYTRWLTMPGTPTGSSVLISAYGFDKCPPPEGENVLMLKVIGATAAVAGVTFAESGEYELSYMMTSRDTASQGGQLHNYLTDANSATVEIGTATATTIRSWTDQKTLRFTVDAAGTYTLHFDFVSPWYNGTTGRDATVLVNSLHLYRVGGAKRVCRIPNGDFETVSGGVTTQGTVTSFDGTAVAEGWTFDARTDGKYVYSGVSTAATYCEEGRRYGSGYNASHAPLGGVRQALIRRSGGFLSTTFTPAKGTWYLKAMMSRWGDYVDNASVTATVQQGAAAAVSLGQMKVAKDMTMLPYVWPVPFEADGTSAVTLTVTYARASGSGSVGVNLDDLMLVGAYENEYELVSNGDFELPFQADRENCAARTDWTSVVTVKGGCSPRQYGRDNWAFGSDYGSGDYFIEPFNDGGNPGGFYQDIAFPHAGWYRLSYLCKTRADAGNGLDTFNISLVDTALAATNRIDCCRIAGHGCYEQHTALFHVDAAATRRLLFQDDGKGYYLAIDDVSVKYVGTSPADTLSQPDPKDPTVKGLNLRMNSGARLRLDFTGIARVSRFYLDDVRQADGAYNATNCPYIFGAGTLLVDPRFVGSVLSLK